MHQLLHVCKWSSLRLTFCFHSVPANTWWVILLKINMTRRHIDWCRQHQWLNPMCVHHVHKPRTCGEAFSILCEAVLVSSNTAQWNQRVLKVFPILLSFHGFLRKLYIVTTVWAETDGHGKHNQQTQRGIWGKHEMVQWLLNGQLVLWWWYVGYLASGIDQIITQFSEAFCGVMRYLTSSRIQHIGYHLTFHKMSAWFFRI